MKTSRIVSLLSWLYIYAGICFPCQLLGQLGVLEKDPSLMLHFTFDEDFSSGYVMDRSGHGNHGWRFNPDTWITVGQGVFGSKAAQFTYVGYMTNDWPHVYALSQYIAVTNLSGFTYLTNGTISVWACIDTNGDLGMRVLDTGYPVAYSGNPAAASNSWSLGRSITPYLVFTVYPGSGSDRKVVRWPDDTVRSGGTQPILSTTRFHLYTLTIDCPNDQVVAYYDGNPYMSNAIGLPWIRIFGSSTLRWLCIGAMSHSGSPQWGDDDYPNSSFFVGKIDDLRIYNRTLSAAEVQALYVGNTFERNISIQKVASRSVQINWPYHPTVFHQVEWSPMITKNIWVPLGLPIAGLITNYTTDMMMGQSMRYFRVRNLP